MSQPQDVLSFWFDRLPTEPSGNYRKVWFSKAPEFDQAIAIRFSATYEQAAAGLLDSWQATAAGSLALILTLDQFPRNLFRGRPRSFATDGKVLAIANAAIEQGFDQALPPIERWFVYLPFMHSEDLEQQRRSVALFESLRGDPEIASAYTYALKHLEVIEQFGRFPHRNAILDRPSSAEETKFLQQPGSSF